VQVADQSPRIAIIGAGPIGLETALYARYLGYKVQLFERSESAAANVMAWGHVSLFTPFGMNASSLGIAALQAQDSNWHCPAAEETLTGAELYHRYWLPLAQSDLVAGVLECETDVVAIGRQGWLKGDGVGDQSRGNAQFRLLLRHADGTEQIRAADVVIDCTGTYGNHNWLGQGGIPAPGESDAAEHIEYGLADVLGEGKDRFSGKHTLVVGAGYSAATQLTQLAKLPAETTRVTWVTRTEATTPIGRIPDDRLATRDELARQANELATGDYAAVTHYPATTITAIEYRSASDDFEVELFGQQNGRFIFDQIIANVGYRPDNQIYSELQIHECYASGGPMKLAAQLASQLAARAGNDSADCLDQVSCGPDSLRNPEPNFYILGSKSYGRGAQFLLSIGLEQIRDLFTLIGEREDLDLYATMPARR